MYIIRKLKNILFGSIVRLWSVIPFKLLFIKLLKKNSYLKSKLYLDLRYKGNMNLLVEGKSIRIFNPGYTTIENEILWNDLEGWEKVSMALWKELCKHSNFILDIGANTGIYSLVGAAINPKATVFAFEPVARTAALFRKNLELNKELNIHLVEKAVSNRNGECVFYDLPTISQYSASLNEQMLSQYKDRISYTVQTIKLDTMPELVGKKIDLIKLDVEMHEPEAIEGMMTLIYKFQPTLLIEVLTSEIAEKVEALLKDIPYYCFSIDETNEPRIVNNICQSDFHNLLLITKENLYKVDLKV